MQTDPETSTTTPIASETTASDVGMRIGARVHAARRERRMTRGELARRADVSERYLTALEKGAANVSIGILSRVAGVLALDLAGLFAAEPAAPTREPTLSPSFASLLAGLSPSELDEAHAVLARHVADRRRTRKGIALLGLRGAGKSTLGRLLADRLGVPLVSMTALVEEIAGVKVDELFNLGGPEAYRSSENEAVARLVAADRFAIVETAGGVVANGDAFEVILANFRTVWLKAAPEEHLERVMRQGDMRPMKGNPRALDNVRALLASRDALYGRAEIVLDTTGRQVGDCLAELAARIA